ncbi:uncharacterized protein LOC132862434 isoform X1 [Tachysurus vachellii]|uniref:uncharacterized protein LOC132862434 isoform X1 n=2 Tax=Tachysurus vachellii TaxID=175792 RepID=UPI00296B24EE|nr:uncharacterized protein LOC132862434 isoform X1 [Tachysurus vachellii]
MSASQNSCETHKTSIDCSTNGGIAQENSDGADEQSLSVSRLLLARKKKIVLHIDLNNTILVSDAVTKQGTVAALEYFLSTVTWGRMSKGKWEWMCESPSLLPPCKDAVSYYSQFGRVVGFTTVGPGRRFRKVLEEHLNLLRWPSDLPAHKELSVKGEDGKLYHWILPSFFHLLQDLASQGIEFSIFFRTFGTDLPRLLKVVRQVLEHGTHPLFSVLPELKLSVDTTPGQIRCNTKGVILIHGDLRISTQDGERNLYRFLSSSQGLGGFQDQFNWWAQNTYSIMGGKPMWIDPFDSTIQHIFIDDNIRQNNDDTIVHPKVFLDPESSETRTASTSELYDLCLIQTDLLRAISEPSYFTERILICMENYEKNLRQQL